MDLNPNTQNNNKQNQKENLLNTRSKFDNNKRSDKNRSYPQGKNQNTEGNRAAKAQLGNNNKPINQDRLKGRDDAQYSDRPRGHKTEGKQDSKVQLKQPYNSNRNNSSGNSPRYGRNSGRNAGYNEILGRHINTRQIETIDDIKADIERIDKDIQFEIKQIKAVKLGL